MDAIASYVLENAPDLMFKEFEREGVKLHVTLMNSKFPAKAAEDAAKAEREKQMVHRGRWGKESARVETQKFPRERFNATKILKVATHSYYQSSTG